MHESTQTHLRSTHPRFCHFGIGVWKTSATSTRPITREQILKTTTGQTPEVSDVVMNEGGIEFPALPVAESNVIILGRVTSAEAHVSENKKNVYSARNTKVSRWAWDVFLVAETN